MGVFFDGRWLDFATLTMELEPTHWMDVPPQSQGRGSTAGDSLTLIDEDGGGEMRIIRYHRFTLGDRRLQVPVLRHPGSTGRLPPRAS